MAAQEINAEYPPVDYSIPEAFWPIYCCIHSEQHPAVAIPTGLRHLHVRKLYQQRSTLSKLPRHTDLCGDEGPALHAVLFHLAGGTSSNVVMPRP